MKSLRSRAAVALFNLAAFQLFAAADPAPAAGARIQFAASVFDFGRTPEGASLKHDFIFTNTGTATLELSNVVPRCGCTIAGEWSRRVEPGRTGHLSIELKTTNFRGAIAKTVTVSCNDSLQPEIALQVKATIWQPIEVTPPVALLHVNQGSEASATVRIVNRTDGPVTLRDPESNTPGFRAELKEIDPGKEFDLTITAVGQGPSMSRQGQVSLRSSLKDLPVVTVNFLARAQPRRPIVPLTPGVASGVLTNNAAR